MQRLHNHLVTEILVAQEMVDSGIRAFIIER